MLFNSTVLTNRPRGVLGRYDKYFLWGKLVAIMYTVIEIQTKNVTKEKLALIKPTGDFGILWYQSTRIACIALLAILALWEICQILSNIIRRRFITYFFTIFNIVDVTFLFNTTAYFLFDSEDYLLATSLLGWSIFFGYMKFWSRKPFFRENKLNLR